MWSYLQSHLDQPEQFSVAQLRANTSWLEPYSATLNWNETDYQVQQLFSSGISPIIEIGEGTDHSLPTVSDEFNSTSGVADPGTVGMEQYLAYMYRYSRAVVHRYKQDVTIWQIENELNDAYLEALSGIRSPASLIPQDSPWGNFTFVTEIIQTLYMAVKDEDSTLWTTQNLLADTPEDVYSISGIPMYYLDALYTWSPLLDIVSFDVYANYYVAYPIYSDVFVRIIKDIQNVTGTKPIMVAETGVHVMNEETLKQVSVKAVNCTPIAQGEFLGEIVPVVKAAGAMGFQVFKLAETTGYEGASGGYTNQDIKFLQAVTDSIVGNSIQPLLKWAASLRDIRYILDGRAFEVAFAPTTVSYGILDGNGNPTAGFDAL
eukprot:CAMPEP_0117082332 /NCGR_PEP_ID=MMETSP0472-20121206/57983_1 /TAXON_ID=693140 ORGANISM="Tiarina fusus, Strain LIS" /NCGR_SAMPLE_ID=MMETSP0472 /ASSEMBLY_ACC=CAM_ASM_000603 /LENGTH=374 /DNA_ID=CAMNT_0004810537 /DNA_START=295 /DNA_END=1415 /DNA_ORIENTATION=+